jgi:hypothetical protein
VIACAQVPSVGLCLWDVYFQIYFAAPPVPPLAAYEQVCMRVMLCHCTRVCVTYDTQSNMVSHFNVWRQTLATMKNAVACDVYASFATFSQAAILYACDLCDCVRALCMTSSCQRFVCVGAGDARRRRRADAHRALDADLRLALALARARTDSRCARLAWSHWPWCDRAYSRCGCA